MLNVRNICKIPFSSTGYYTLKYTVYESKYIRLLNTVVNNLIAFAQYLNFVVHKKGFHEKTFLLLNL